ncbi:hypothetical protein H4P1_00051 (plasmid) [Variovorax sp. PBS-H4]|uniref:hypothetical protein n=1 Tax=Variovorax sp. PBS-H4 TaxID=434008 RepID=UPI001318EB6E|nr:hypothetical protein [Variovorax sp. PBS-H4]VTU41419.1 hypothetical protein H4P1_00051 [Variovorax sp. PBS-H4]
MGDLSADLLMLRRVLGKSSIVLGIVAGTVVFAAGTAAADVTVTYSVDENGAPTAVVSADPYDPGADAIAANSGQYWLTEPSEPLPLLLLRCFDGAWVLGPGLPAIEDVSYVTIDPNTFDPNFSPAVFLDQTLCNPLIETPVSSPTSVSSAPSITIQPTVTIGPSSEVATSSAGSSPAVTDSAASTVVSTSTSASGSESVAPTTAASTSAAAAPAATTAATTSAAHAGPALAATGTAPEGALYTALALLAGGASLAYLGTKQRRRQSHS